MYNDRSATAPLVHQGEPLSYGKCPDKVLHQLAKMIDAVFVKGAPVGAVLAVHKLQPYPLAVAKVFERGQHQRSGWWADRRRGQSRPYP